MPIVTVAGRVRPRALVAVLALAGLAGLAGNGLAASAPPCAGARERAAIETRVLQSELMVAALSCNARQRYNSFALRHGRELAAQGRVLRAYFRRIDRDNADERLDRFVTRLANEAAERSIDGRSRYCGRASLLFDQVLSPENGDLHRAAARLPATGATPACGDRVARF